MPRPICRAVSIHAFRGEGDFARVDLTDLSIEHDECDDEKVALGRGAGGSGSDGLNVAGEITPTQ